jgi:hypothetical protein
LFNPILSKNISSYFCFPYSVDSIA